MQSFSTFLSETATARDHHTIGHETYRGKTIEITGVGFRYREGGQHWERDSLSAIKDLIDSKVNAKMPPRRWRY